MWECEHSIETSASPATIWALWTDVGTWKAWNEDIAAVEIKGEFAVGGEITMTPVGQEPVLLRIAEVVEGESFADEADLGDVVVRTEHRLEQLGGDRLRVVYRTRITGPAAVQVGPELGPAIISDFPETMNALVELAGR